MDVNNEMIHVLINVALRDSTFKPPSILYKYLSDERVEDVLGNGSVRFTPLENTNDLFEVRAPFKNFAGPKLIKTIEYSMGRDFGDDDFNRLFKKSFDIFIKQNRIPLQDRDQLFKYIKNTMGKEIREKAENGIKKTNLELIPSLNSKEQINKVLKAIGKLLCFSLSECANINLMWAHYANSHKGFVIAFDTESAWFKEWKNEESKHLLKVHYFDDKMKEPFDDPYKAIVSKKTDWEYEREWRIYTEEYQADAIKETTEEPIYLMNFPPEAVQRIILGTKINPEVESRIKEIVDAKYPHAKIYRMRSNPVESRLEEVEV